MNTHIAAPKRRWVAATLFFVASALITCAQPFSINWYKVAGGGGVSSNATFQVSGTIGQLDASGAMTGGGFSVTGGFWSLVAVQTPGSPLLTITLSNNQAVISWPLSATGFTLQTSSNLAAGIWTDYIGAVVNNSVTNSPPKGTVFFRLKNP